MQNPRACTDQQASNPCGAQTAGADKRPSAMSMDRKWNRTDKTKTEKTDANGGDSSEGGAGSVREAKEKRGRDSRTGSGAEANRETRHKSKTSGLKDLLKVVTPHPERRL